MSQSAAILYCLFFSSLLLMFCWCFFCDTCASDVPVTHQVTTPNYISEQRHLTLKNLNHVQTFDLLTNSFLTSAVLFPGSILQVSPAFSFFQPHLNNYLIVVGGQTMVKHCSRWRTGWGWTCKLSRTWVPQINNSQ